MPLSLLSLMLLGFVLRIYGLGHQPLWFDEGYTAYLQGQSPRVILSSLVPDHVPLHYLLLHYWTHVAGSSEFALRFISVAFGTATLPVVYLLGRDLAGRRAGWAALALASSSPFLVYWAQQARVTSMALFFATASVFCCLRCVSHVEDRSHGHRVPMRYWLGWTVFSVLGMYTFYYVGLVILATNVFALVRLRSRYNRNFVRPWLLSQSIVLLLFAPWALSRARLLLSYVSPAQTGRVTLDWATPMSPRAVGELPTGLYQIAWQVWRTLAVGETAARDERWTLLTIFTLLSCLGAAVLIRRGRSAIVGPGFLLGLWLILPILIVSGIDQRAQDFSPRHFLIIAPAFYALAAAAVWHRPGQTRRLGRLRLVAHAGLLSLAVIGSLYYSVRSYASPPYVNEDYRSIALFLDENAHPGDVVVLDAKWQYPAFAYYYRGKLPLAGLPAEYPLDEAQTAQALRALAEEYSGIWFVNARSHMSDPTGYVENWLSRNTFSTGERRWFGAASVSGYIPPLADQSDSMALAHPADVTIGGDFALRAYDISTRRALPGDTIVVRLYWEALRPTADDYHVFVHLQDSENSKLLAQQDGTPLRGARPTSTWQPGEVLRDEYVLRLPLETEPGTYDLVAGMYTSGGTTRLPVMQRGMSVYGRGARLERVKVPLPVTSAELPSDFQAIGSDFGGMIRLVGDRVQFRTDDAHDSLTVDLLWQQIAPPTDDYTVFVQLLDDSGRLRSQSDQPPVGGRYGTSIWETDEVVPDRHILPLAPDMQPGSYDLIAGLYSPTTLRRLPDTQTPESDFVLLARLDFPAGN